MAPHTHTDIEAEQFVLKTRPSAEITDGHYERQPLSISGSLAPHQILVRAHFISVDPYMRIQHSATHTWEQPHQLGTVQPAAVLGSVLAVGSAVTRFSIGEIVCYYDGWRTHARLSEHQLTKAQDAQSDLLPHLLGAFGMPGRTAWMGVQEHGHVKPTDTVLVSAASGAVGHIAAQLAALSGARVIAVAGAEHKVQRLQKELQLDAISYLDPNWANHVEQLAPNGIDLFFDAVGGTFFEKVMPIMNTHGRVIVCGLVSQYNGLLDTPEKAPRWLHHVLYKRLNIQGFLARDSNHRSEEIQNKLLALYRHQKLIPWVTVVEGFEKLPHALAGLLKGQFIGKAVVKVC